MNGPETNGGRLRRPAKKAHRLDHAGVPALLLLGAAAAYLLLGVGATHYYIFFLPVAFAGAGLGARAGVISALVSVTFVAAVAAAAGRQYLTGELPADAIDASPFIMWGALVTLTGYVVGLISERGGSRGVGRDLSSEIMHAVEREHARIGHDMHDTVAQTAASSVMEAEILDSMLAEAPAQVRAQSERLVRALHSSVDEVRALIVDLRPPSLAGDQFLDTLYGLIDDFSDRTGIKVEYSVEGTPQNHSDSIRICMFRVVQEALTNIENHARASRVFVSVRSTKKTVYLLVSDDGVGFDPSKVNGGDSNGHLGVRGMRERVALLGGELEVESVPKGGTGVRARIPAL